MVARMAKAKVMATKKPQTAKAPRPKNTRSAKATATKKTQSAKTTTPAAPAPTVAGERFWLVKSEPDVYAITDLERDGTTGWEGVRNYQARNSMRDGMKLGDLVLFYHSNAEPPGIAGVAKVSGLAEPDPSQFDAKSEFYDAGSKKSEPRWLMVRLAFVERFDAVLALERLKGESALVGMPLLQKGQRLSVQPVAGAHFAHVMGMAGAGVVARGRVGRGSE